ncbi:DUF1800 domain-containing protein [Limibacter armeniacum]|uniref:DUF1800 domain-containing protein n=1 Tax=Limibacter armeniacum TaxID=466084 RepID=UPI002FE506CD
MKLNQKQIQHFFLRAGFGEPLEKVAESLGKTPQSLFEEQVALSKKTVPVKVESDFASPGELKQMSAKSRQEMAKAGREEVKELNIKWLKEMASSDAQLREKMAFFWHDHFACRSQNPNFLQGYLDAIRENALGNFGELLRAVSKSPAMLQYLNNQQNKKSSPNENFAREVMELFTLGRDQGYTENDISEAARAFTGWSFDKKGTFIIREKQHDQGVKTVLGKSGNLDGDDVIDLLLKNKQTASYISQKWVSYFMNYEGDKKLEKQIADELYRTDYNILAGLEVLFTSREFYHDSNIGRRIKSPIELIASMQRQLHVTITHDQSLLFLQRTLGQVLFNPPNVAGWCDGQDWVDSATLMFRMNLPQLVFKAALIQQQDDSFDDNDKFKLKGPLRKLETIWDKASMQKSFSRLKPVELADYLLQTEVKGITSTGDFIDQVIDFTSKPEFQLC